MNHYQPEETIAAIATPPGEGGVAIVRISGKSAIDVAQKVFSGPVRSYKSHTAHYGRVLNANGETIDDVLLLPMLAPRSYTGEDTIEIQCHGGSLITRRVLEAILQAGARPARPGEFTFRAFMNGKLDLAQAEAVQALIGAKNEHALDAAEQHLRGALSQKIRQFQHALVDVAAILEAWVDFPEEGLEFATHDEMHATLSIVCMQMEQLLRTFHDGRVVHDGIALCLVGSPNVGKSSLMNALLDKERAIVSHIPGTTRDILEDHLSLNGLNIRLLDTAGIRDSEEVIEQEGIRRSRDAMQQADLILLVLDAQRGISAEEQRLMADIPHGKAIAVWNKIDLPHEALPILPLSHLVSISAKEKQGLDQLKQQIDAVIWEKGPPARDEVLITSVRHKDALAQAIQNCYAVMEGLTANASPEFVSLDMRACLQNLGRIIGTDITDDILSAIFSKFCIGK